jgi:DNA ligase-1
VKKIIYKIDSKGKKRFLSFNVIENRIIQQSGIVGSDNVVEHIKTCKAKNIGKVNETSPEAQALLETKAKIKLKLSEDYFETLEQAQTTKVILPMLAKSYDKQKKKIDWSNNVFVQPKLDGMRAITINNKLVSRTGKAITTLNHIENDLNLINNNNIHFDGELYLHGESFQNNMKLIKKYRKGETEKINYYVYDLISPEPFHKRFDLLSTMLLKAGHIKVVPTYKIRSEDELNEYHIRFLNDGFEGTMVRHGIEPYKVNGRSAHLLKYKDFKDIAVKVIDIIPAEQKPQWGIPVLMHENGCVFRAGTRFSHAEREDLLKNKNKYIGLTAEIRYFEETDDGIPRFPVCVGFRLDK